MLTATHGETGVIPTTDFPRVYACMMDFGLSGHMISVFATSSGDASLYSTSQFGIIGGGEHEPVRSAGMTLVRIADENFDLSSPARDIGYPDKDAVRFYLLTFEGLRRIDAPQSELGNENSPCYKLYAAGQELLGQLRIASGG